MERVIEYEIVSDDKYHYTSGYFTARKWTKKGDLILARYMDEEHYETDKCELVYYSVSERRITDVLCEDVYGHDDMVYYCTTTSFKSINIETGEKKTIYEYSDVCFKMPHITYDGKYVNLEGHKEDGSADFLLINLETGEAEIAFTKKFVPPFQIANHGMICPTDHNLIYFAHEGTTEYITNRMWIYDKKSNRTRNITKQMMTEDGDLGECFGHEMWSADGKGLYFVKYPQSPIKPAGICYVDLETGEKEVLFSEYAYWHVSTSKDGKYLLGDTMRGVYDGTDFSEVVLMDIEKNTEEIIDVVHSTGKHPCHPHPSISPDSKVVVYTAFEDGKIVAKLAFLKE